MAQLSAKASSVICCLSLPELALATISYATPWLAIVMPTAPLSGSTLVVAALL